MRGAWRPATHTQPSRRTRPTVCVPAPASSDRIFPHGLFPEVLQSTRRPGVECSLMPLRLLLLAAMACAAPAQVSWVKQQASNPVPKGALISGTEQEGAN